MGVCMVQVGQLRPACTTLPPGTMAKSKVTSTKAAKAASKVLRDGRTGKASKAAAGSALSQKPPSKRKK